MGLHKFEIEFDSPRVEVEPQLDEQEVDQGRAVRRRRMPRPGGWLVQNRMVPI
jgi:hypothetical protein